MKSVTTRARQAVTLVDLSTGNRRNFDSLKQAYNHIGVGDMTGTKMVRNQMAFKNWYMYHQGNDDQHEEVIEELMRRYKRRGPFKKCTAAWEELVSLRIDRHTVIMVPKAKATAKYAEEYREKLAKAQKRI